MREHGQLKQGNSFLIIDQFYERLSTFRVTVSSKEGNFFTFVIEGYKLWEFYRFILISVYQLIELISTNLHVWKRFTMRGDDLMFQAVNIGIQFFATTE